MLFFACSYVQQVKLSTSFLQNNYHSALQHNHIISISMWHIQLSVS